MGNTHKTFPSIQPAQRARQQQFVDEYLMEVIATQATFRAGYFAKSPLKNLRKPNIETAISQASSNVARGRESKAETDGDWLLQIEDHHRDR